MEEVLFRGYIMKLLENRWNKAVAIFVPSLIFGLIHLPNISSIETLDVILLSVAGTSVGVMFSLITYSSRNVWSAALVHAVWNIFIIGRFIKISANIKETSNPLLRYRIENESFFWTGGNFGIEASLPATLCYISVIFIALFWWKNGKTQHSF